MKRIGYLVPEFPNQTHAFFWREIEALRSLGHQVFPISTRRPSVDACRHAFAASARAQTQYVAPPIGRAFLAGTRAVRGVPKLGRYLLTMETRGASSALRHLVLATCAMELAGLSRTLRLDHIHVHSAADAAHLAAMCHLVDGTPYSLTLHGDLDVYGVDHALKVEGAKFVTAVTRPLRRQLVERTGMDATRVPVLWMGVDTAAFCPPATEPAERPLQLLTVARLNRQKGHRFALAAVRRCLDQGIQVSYTIAGTGDYEQALREEIQQYGVASAVTLFGAASEQEVLRLLRASHVFMLTSVGLGEAAPVSVMEAMACGRLVVCSRIGGTSDMISHGQDGFLVEQSDDVAIAEVLTQIAQGQVDTARVRSAARLRACSAFAHDVLAQKLSRAIDGDVVGASLYPIEESREG